VTRACSFDHCCVVWLGDAVCLQTFKYNTLETLYLTTAMFILLSGKCDCV
jgi:hypothetical protein